MSPEQVYAELRSYALSKEGAAEDFPWGDVAFKIKGKMFACTNEHSSKISVKSTLDKQAALVQHPQIEPSHYVGRYGWVTVDVNDNDTLELAKELIDESYDMIASKRKKPANVVKER